MQRSRTTGRRRGTIGAIGGVALLSAALIACGGSDEAGDLATSGGSSGGSGGTMSSLVGPEAPGGFADGNATFPQVGRAEERAAEMGAPAADAASPPQQTGGSAADFLGRSIIRNGQIDLEVSSVVDTFEQISGIAVAAGGFVADSGFRGRDEDQSATMTLRVPADRFEQVLADLRELAVEVNNVSTSAQDVTGEVTDLQSALRNLQAVEQQYLELLSRANEIGDVLTVQDRLNQVRYEIEQVQGRIHLLDRLAEMATLSVSLRPHVAEVVEAEPGTGPLAEARRAWDASLETLTAIGTVALVTIVYSWWLLPVLVLAAIVLRRMYRSWNRDRGVTVVRPPSIDSPQGTA